jgi:hypothetical protein
VMVTSRLKVSFWLDGSTSPGNYGWLFFILYFNKKKIKKYHMHQCSLEVFGLVK